MSAPAAPRRARVGAVTAWLRRLGRRARPPPRPRIVLHIGRNKAGSTTIQDACLAGLAELRAAGVNYVPFGHLADSVPGAPGFATFESLVAYARTRPHETQLVSNEFLFGWPGEYTDAAAVALKDCDVRLIAYVRPYDAWVVSAYAEETRRGMNTRDIDAYLGAMASRISAWPYLAKWAEAFGWDRLRVRDLAALRAAGRDLMADFAEALGIAPLAGPTPRSNPSPHWTELELARRLAERDGEVEWVGVAREELEPLLAVLRPLARREPPRPYLGRAQRAGLVELYNADLDRLRRAGLGGLAPAPPPDGPERASPSALDDASPALLQAFFADVTTEGFATAHPAAAARARRLAQEMGYATGAAGSK